MKPDAARGALDYAHRITGGEHKKPRMDLFRKSLADYLTAVGEHEVAQLFIEQAWTGDYDKRRLIEWLRAETARATGRRYQIDFDALDVQSLRELIRLIHDLTTRSRRR